MKRLRKLLFPVMLFCLLFFAAGVSEAASAVVWVTAEAASRAAAVQAEDKTPRKKTKKKSDLRRNYLRRLFYILSPTEYGILYRKTDSLVRHGLK